MDVTTPTVTRLRSTDEAVALVYADGSYGGSAKSPDGKFEATIRDPDAGKSELVVADKVAVPGVKIKRFWWIANDAMAAISYSDEKTLELRIIKIPNFNTFGHYLQARSLHQ